MVFSISLILVIGGTIGNLIDRIVFRSVTDMFDFIILGYDFPVFNVADIFLVFGFALFIIDMVFLNKEVAKEKKEEKKEELTSDVVEENVEEESNEGNN